METALNVEVHSGIQPPPGVEKMEEPDGYKNSGQTTLIPWRVGSGSHLGIMRGSASMNDILPPYS